MKKNRTLQGIKNFILRGLFTKGSKTILIIFSLAFFANGCKALKSKTNEGPVPEDKTQPKASSTCAGATQPQSQATKESLNLFESYLVYRDGSPASSSVQESQVALKSYEENYSKNLRPYNQVMILAGSDRCKRYLGLFDILNIQSIGLYNSYLNTKMSGDSITMTKARASILKFFESSFINLGIVGNEVGQLDLIAPNGAEQCQVPDRKDWNNRLLENHQKMQTAYQTIFGQQSFESPDTLASSVAKIRTRFESDKTKMQVGFFGVEAFTSGILWKKSVESIAGLLRKTLSATRFLPSTRYAYLIGSAVYILGWTTIDITANDSFSFLKPELAMPPDSASPSWDGLMTMTKVFTDSTLMSPGLDYGYLQLIDVIRRHEALTFLSKNNQQLKDAELKYSSVDKAYKNLIEEQGRCPKAN